MNIDTERMVMRPFTLEDAKEYWRIIQEVTIKEGIFAQLPNTLEDCREIIQNNYSKTDFVKDFAFVLKSKETSEILGSLIAFKNSSDNFAVNLLIAEEQKGHDYITEAINAFVEKMPKNSKFIFLVKEKDVPMVEAVQKLPKIREYTYFYRSVNPETYKEYQIFKM